MNTFALALRVILLICIFQLNVTEDIQGKVFTNADFMERDTGAIIHMTLEFLKDMDMKMRDVRRVESKYISTEDFGAGKIFSAIEHTFRHMITLYKNTSRISYTMPDKGVRRLREDVAGSLSFMLSDYMQLLSQIDLYRGRFDYWQHLSTHVRIRNTVQVYLIKHKQYPYRYTPDP